MTSNDLQLYFYACDANLFQEFKKQSYFNKIEAPALYFSDLTSLCKATHINTPSILILNMVGCDIPLDLFLFVFKKFTSVIIISSNAEHAVWAFDNGAIDFLFYPYLPERFNVALIKASTSLRTSSTQLPNSNLIYVRCNREMLPIKTEDIVYIQAMGNYIRIHLVNNKSITSLEKISFFSHRLPKNNFQRTHKSYIVNRLYIKSWNKSEIVLSNDNIIPISITYRHFLTCTQ